MNVQVGYDHIKTKFLKQRYYFSNFQIKKQVKEVECSVRELISRSIQVVWTRLQKKIDKDGPIIIILSIMLSMVLSKIVYMILLMILSVILYMILFMLLTITLQGVSEKNGRCFVFNFFASWVTRIKVSHIFH